MFTIVTNKLNQKELNELIQSIKLSENIAIECHPVEKVAGDLEAAIIVSVITGGISIIVSLINGLFLLRSKKKESNNSSICLNYKTVIVTMDTGKKLNIFKECHLIANKDIESGNITEIRLE